MDETNDILEYDSDFQFNELTKMIRFEDNIHLFALVNNLRNNQSIFDEIQFENINDIYFEFEFNEDILKEWMQTSKNTNVGGSGDGGDDQGLDCDDYFALIDDFKDSGKISICSQFEQNKLANIKEQNSANENRREESLEEKSKFLRRWIADNELKRNGNETDGAYQAEQFMLKLVQKTHYLEWMKKRCFLCLNRYLKVKTFRCDEAAVFTHDNCSYTRFVCYDCSQYANTILEYLNQMNFAIDFPPIKFRRNPYKINEVIETIAGRDRRRSKNARDLLETNFVEISDCFVELERTYKNTNSYSSAKNILQELKLIMGVSRRVYEICQRIGQAYLESQTNPDWRLDFVELKNCTFTKDNILLPLRPPAAVSDHEKYADPLELVAGTVVYCPTGGKRSKGLKSYWELARIVRYEENAGNLQIVWLNENARQKKKMKGVNEIASFHINSKSFPVAAVVISNYFSDASNKPLFVTGHVLETISRQNFYRYLIWFETNEYRYVHHYMIRAISFADEKTTALRPPGDRFDSKLKSTLVDQNTIFIKHNDVYETAVILMIDCSLVLLEHLDCKQLEWKLISDTVLFKNREQS